MIQEVNYIVSADFEKMQTLELNSFRIADGQIYDIRVLLKLATKTLQGLEFYYENWISKMGEKSILKKRYDHLYIYWEDGSLA